MPVITPTKSGRKEHRLEAYGTFGVVSPVRVRGDSSSDGYEGSSANVQTAGPSGGSRAAHTPRGNPLA
jgi:hypothetical protein